MNETLTVLNSINEKLGLVLEMLSADSTPVKPKYVEVAERVLSVGNAALEEVVPAIIEERCPKRHNRMKNWRLALS